MALLTLHRSRVGLALGLIMAIGGTALALTADEAFEKREAGMKAAGGALKALGGAAKGGAISPEDVAKAEGLADFAASIPDLFPEGSVTAKSRALPEIWSDKAGWEAKIKDFQGATAAVLAAAKAGDAAALGAAIDQTGPTCGGCHKAFRGPEKN